MRGRASSNPIPIPWPMASAQGREGSCFIFHIAHPTLQGVAKSIFHHQHFPPLARGEGNRHLDTKDHLAREQNARLKVGILPPVR